MATEHWALLISCVALAVSIAIPIWQRKLAISDTLRSKRTYLLQRILAARSVAYIASHELSEVIRRHGHKMEAKQKADLLAQVPRLKEHARDLEELHRLWSNYDDGAAVEDIEKSIAIVNVIAADAEDTATMIESGRRSYEDS